MSSNYIKKALILISFMVSACSCSGNKDISVPDSTLMQVSNTTSYNLTEIKSQNPINAYQTDFINTQEQIESTVISYINEREENYNINVTNDEIYFIDHNTSEIFPTHMDKSIKYVNVDSENNSLTSMNGIVYTKDLKTLLWCPANYEENTIVIPDTVNEIDSYAFYSCNKINEIIMGNNVHTIDIGAFSKCESLVKIKISENLLFLGNDVFQYCKNLEEVILPDSLFSVCENEVYADTIGSQIFSYCDSLKRIRIPTNLFLSYYENPSGFYEFENNFVGCNMIKEIELAESVSEIDIYNGALSISSFSGICKLLPEYHIEKFIIPTETVALGSYAFENCVDLKELVVLPYKGNSERRFFIDGERTLKNCYQLENLLILDDTYICNIQIEKFPNLTFYTSKGSYADEYAIKHGFPIIYINNYDDYLNIAGIQ